MLAEDGDHLHRKARRLALHQVNLSIRGDYDDMHG